MASPSVGDERLCRAGDRRSERAVGATRARVWGMDRRCRLQHHDADQTAVPALGGDVPEERVRLRSAR